MPVAHVIRAVLPWRTDLPEHTECGRDLANVPGDTITYAEFHEAATEYTALVRSYQRAKMKIPALVRRPNICKTCWDKAAHYPSWDRNPIRRLWRHLDQFGYFPAGRDAERMCRELWAMARLATRHRNEFNALVAEMDLGYQRD